MAVIVVVTSAPPLVEGGHLVIARALERALDEAGHRAGLVTTPSNRFGRQGAGVPRQLADRRRHDGRRRARRSGHHAAVSELRGAASAARLLAEPHDARVLRPLGRLLVAGCRRRGGSRRRVRRTLIHAADTYFFTHHVDEAVRAVRSRPRPAARVERRRRRGAAPAAAAARVPVRRLRRLSVLRVAADAAQARRSRPAGAGATGGRARPVRHRRGGGGRARLAQARARARRRRPRDVHRPAERRRRSSIHLARCRAVVFPPKNEDYGFVTVEAFASARPSSRAPTAAVRSSSCAPARTASSRHPMARALARAISQVQASVAAGARGSARRRSRTSRA